MIVVKYNLRWSRPPYRRILSLWKGANLSSNGRPRCIFAVFSAKGPDRMSIHARRDTRAFGSAVRHFASGNIGIARYIMLDNLKCGSAVAALVCIAVGSMTGGASAVTAEIAKKCETLADKAYPPRVLGNPAAGSAAGTAQSKRNYFSKCLANGGNMDDALPLPPARPDPPR